MSTTTEERTAAEHVRLAIEHLDLAAPEGWRERVNLDKLDLFSLDYCVLAQIWDGSYDGYFAGMEALSAHDPEWTSLYDDDVYADNEKYLAEWKHQLGASR